MIKWLQRFAGTVLAAGALAGLALPSPALAWGHMGHRIIGYLTVEGLPADLPVFLRSSADEMGELAREQDRSKGSGRIHDTDRDPAHFIDLDDNAQALGGPSIDRLPPTREAYETALRAVNQNSWDAGYLPYEIVASWQQLRTDFAYWRMLNAVLARPLPPERRAWYERDLLRRQASLITNLGTLAHLVGDGSQPLHTTSHYNGWGNYPNPRNYTTARIHAQIDGDLVRNHVTLEATRAAMAPYRNCNCEIEQRTAAYIRASWTFVEPLYQMYGAGTLQAGNAQGREFAVARVAAGAAELRDMIIDAWRASATARVGYPALTTAQVEGGADPWNALHGAD